MKRLLVGTGIALLVSAVVLVGAFNAIPVANAMVESGLEATARGFDCANVTQIPQSECEALVAFYYATGGDEWYNHSGWLMTNTPCEWYGISCNTGHVTGLDSGLNALSGNIPPHLADLSHLTLLSLRGWTLNGVIPPELGTLSELDTFKLYHNSTISIPPELGNLSNLQILEISIAPHPDHSSEQRSAGCATLPPEVGNLTNLQVLLITYSLCSSLPPELGNLSNLKQLRLSNNGLTGSIPPELGKLSMLTHLALGNFGTCTQPPILPDMTGPLPPELGNLSHLEFLDVSCESFSGPVPLTFTNLLELEWFAFASSDANYLCEPPEQVFQDWIAGVENVYSTGILCEPASQQLYLPGVMR